MSDFWSDPSSTSILQVFDQRRLWRDFADAKAEPSLVAYVISTITSRAGSTMFLFVHIPGIRLTLRGKCHTEWKINKAGERRTVKEDEYYIDDKKVLWGKGNSLELDWKGKQNENTWYQPSSADRTNYKVSPDSVENERSIVVRTVYIKKMCLNFI